MKSLDLSPNAPWKQRFRLPIIAATSLARTYPSRGLVVTNRSGVYQLHAWKTDTGELNQVTHSPTGTVFGGIAPNGRYIYYLKDEGGAELGHFVRVPFEGGEPEDLTPDMPPYASFSISQSLAGNLLGFSVAGNDGFNMYLVELGAEGEIGERRILYHTDRLSYGPMLSYNGDYAIVTTTEHSQFTDTSLLAFRVDASDAAQDIRLLREDDGSINPVAFAPLPGDTRLLATTNVSGFDRPIIWDVAIQERTDIPLPTLEGDIIPWGWSPDGTRILMCQFNQAKYQLYIYNVDRSTLLQLEHPSGTFQSGYFFDNDTIFVNHQSATSPSQLVALDAATGEMMRVVLSVEDAPDGRPWKSVTFNSKDGTPIQAWVAVPEGEGQFPMILHTHGGPTAAQPEAYDPAAQSWLDHGFAYMSVNYRGSTTFGREFENAINGRLGELEVDDMAAARDYAVENGIADPDSILLYGGSYGGYLTLQAIGRRPELWAGGIGVVAIADWNLMYEDQAETLRGYQRSLFGGGPEEKGEQYTKSSPITYVDQIRAPLLIIQGRNDTRCPVRQMEAYLDKMETHGKDVEVEWFDAGHGSRDNEQNIEQHERMLRWAMRVLG
jgi:dipeptidyl aminopeptidase/acylaminoacyl peptidase